MVSLSCALREEGKDKYSVKGRNINIVNNEPYLLPREGMKENKHHSCTQLDIFFALYLLKL